MDFGKALSNPYVIGGGLLVGALILFSRGSGGGSPEIVQADSVNALYAYAAETGSQATMLEQTRIAAQVRNSESFRGALVNLVGAEYAYKMGMAEINSGVTKAQIYASTALAIDQNDNAARIKMTKIENKTTRQVAKIDSKTAVKVTKLETKAAQEIAETQANAAIASSAISGVTGLIGGFLG